MKHYSPHPQWNNSPVLGRGRKWLLSLLKSPVCLIHVCFLDSYNHLNFFLSFWLFLCSFFGWSLHCLTSKIWSIPWIPTFFLSTLTLHGWSQLIRIGHDDGLSHSGVSIEKRKRQTYWIYFRGRAVRISKTRYCGVHIKEDRQR